ncbi:inhibitor of MCP methylation protein [Alkalihalobacillus alcalophilus ATCC 27647 = CGMCC 1.3604]|uniref:Chemotaxis protein CheC n=1 Tax=Alkalihalobacillus alcalophilus ATCC 27647 = CGMCC 1.3604 TaxID=1218173 RepID=A0A094WGR0_ALKAL|nr:chemotaxis protein CheC [Alkalihalobacillus alcalophilus]KGA95971.1 chemotaxis protein CheC [Alkalihalobacillus alcalophilus ATCC 27647 = CGMCC 1.3604]MED1561908.1 chemotaxis protein CheC [Alkalihalobacillus alcalophilus]THG90958.1 inhibitor of MCP methylation protein [Alkalihalobacillus alcalophilus ATCC 27647 = CGMCC 1.3604]
MNTNHVNAICQATQLILTSHFGLVVNALAPTAGKGHLVSEDISVILGVKGQLKGQIICTFSSQTAQKIIGVMMGGMQIDQIDEMGWSAVQEFGNWVAGTTATELSKEGCVIDVTPPIVNEGESNYHSINPFISIPLDSDIGEIGVHISVQEVVETY